MAIQTINLGSYANDGTGDDLRTAFQKVNANFASLTTTINVATAENIGGGVGIFKQKSIANLEFKSLTSIDSSVEITAFGDTVDLKATSTVSTDTSPELGGNLNLNNFYVYGGDVQTTVYGYDVPTIANLVQLLIQSNNNIDINMGFFVDPTELLIEMNGTGNINFIDSATNQTILDFGYFVQQ